MFTQIDPRGDPNMEDKDRMDDLETVVPPEEAREEPEEE